MKTKFFAILGTIATLAVLSPCLTPNRAMAQPEPESRQGLERIIGTWRVLVTPTPTPAGTPQPFFAYVTFNQGGTAIESSADPLEGSRPGQGIWRKTDGNEYRLTFEKFIEFNPLTQQQGIFVFRAEETINLTSSSRYQGSGLVSICNNAGQECQPLGPATTEGQRLRLMNKS